MTTYIQQQFARARNLSAANNSNQFRLQIVGLRGHTNWLNVSPDQLKKIEEILDEKEVENLPAHFTPLNELRDMIIHAPTPEEADQIVADLNTMIGETA